MPSPLSALDRKALLAAAALADAEVGFWSRHKNQTHVRYYRRLGDRLRKIAGAGVKRKVTK